MKASVAQALQADARAINDRAALAFRLVKEVKHEMPPGCHSPLCAHCRSNEECLDQAYRHALITAFGGWTS